MMTMMRGLEPNPRLAEKTAGLICFRHDCTEPNPQHAVIWRCPAGHTLRILYCAAHGAEHARSAVRHAGVAGPLCEVCGIDGDLATMPLMLPVVEG